MNQSVEQAVLAHDKKSIPFEERQDKQAEERQWSLEVTQSGIRCHRNMLSGLVDSDRKMATMMDSFAARRMMHKMFEGLPTHRRSVKYEATLWEMSDKVRPLKIMMKIKGGRKELDVWPIRKGILDMHRNKVLGGLQS